LVNDPAVMAVVGPFNSGVAAAEMPIVNSSGGPVLISPANTNPGLTLQEFAAPRGFDWNKLHPAGKPDYYFRIPANDFVQGQVETQVALSSQVNCHKAFIIDDNTAYGKGLADYFTTHYTQAGGTTVGSRTSITPDQVSTFPQLATTVKSSGADCTFYGGVTSQGGAALKKALVAAGYNGPMISGDGIAADPGWISTAGAAAVGSIATTPAPDPSTLTSSDATKFKSDYTAYVQGKSNNDLIPYSAYGYVAALIEITAIKSLINANKAVTRLAVRDEIAKIQYSGITGNVSFDANGDNAGAKVFAVYAVAPTDPTKWAYQTTINA
jgi:branched-chain amino acid transport system substrate-binding protein